MKEVMVGINSILVGFVIYDIIKRNNRYKLKIKQNEEKAFMRANHTITKVNLAIDKIIEDIKKEGKITINHRLDLIDKIDQCLYLGQFQRNISVEQYDNVVLINVYLKGEDNIINKEINKVVTII